MVGGEVQPHTGLDAEIPRQREPEARAFDDEGVDVVAERRDQRGLGVAHRRDVAARFTNHRRRKQSRGRLAVGAGDSDHRSRPVTSFRFPPVGEFDFGQHLATKVCRNAEQGV